MVSIRLPIYNSSSPLSKLLGSFISASITTGIIVTPMFYNFFDFLERSKYLSFFSPFFDFPYVVCWNGQIHYTEHSLFFLIIMMSGLRLQSDALFLSQNPRESYASHSQGQILTSTDSMLKFLFYNNYHIRVFHSFSWWSFTGVWVTASLLKSPGLFSGFWPF